MGGGQPRPCWEEDCGALEGGILSSGRCLALLLWGQEAGGQRPWALS